MEPIAIVGLGCRFPGADHPQAFWELLRAGKEAITEVPGDRWDIEQYYDRQLTRPGKMNTRWAGFLKQIDGFDADFFGMSAEEAEHTDPQQRLFLEVAWEALEQAGIVPTELAGTQTGVFVGLCTIDYHRLLYKDFACIGPHSGTGTTPCITANRLSYLLDLRGPSLSIDAACASSLVTVHLACQSLRSGESDLCLAGGVNLILSPDSTIASSQTRLLSDQGQCKPFDANANGYVRGEGCGIVVLKRYSDAIRDGDNVLALIRGSAINQDGLSNSLTAPNGLAQQALIRQALRNASVNPADISYIEAHAVGTAIGDAIEFKALKAVLMEGRSSDPFAQSQKIDRRCWIGSAKPNIGHLEAASGMAALIKVVLSLQHREIPPQLHIEQLNPYIALENTPFSIPAEVQPWIHATEPRLAGISAFGFGGTNAHIILEEAPDSVSQKGIFQEGVPQKDASQKKSLEPPLYLFTLSAKTNAALREMAQQYETFLNSSVSVSIQDLCFTVNQRRSHFDHRLCFVTCSISQLRQQLQSFLAGEIDASGFQGRVRGRKQSKTLFYFPGTGANPVIGCNLYRTQAVFRQAFDRCIEMLQSCLTPWFSDVLPLFLLQSIPYSPPVLFALEYALAELWQSWGITPRAVSGQGVGAYVAACVAGVFCLEDAVDLMLESIQIEQVQLLQKPLWMEQNNDRRRRITQSIEYFQPRIPFISSHSGESIGHEVITPDYWYQQMQQRAEIAMNSAVFTKYDLCLNMELRSMPEISETSSETSSGIELNAQSSGANNVPRLCNQEPADWFYLLANLAVLYVRGVAIDWSGFYGDSVYRRLQLPTYPFQRQRYWFKPVAKAPEPDHLVAIDHAISA